MLIVHSKLDFLNKVIEDPKSKLFLSKNGCKKLKCLKLHELTGVTVIYWGIN